MFFFFYFFFEPEKCVVTVGEFERHFICNAIYYAQVSGLRSTVPVGCIKFDAMAPLFY